jgi:hypothetical protein
VVAYVEETRHVDVHQPAVPVVGHTAAVVDLGDQVLERVPRRLIVLVEVQPQAQLGHLEIGIVEIVRDIPPQIEELAPVDEHGVEPAHGVEQLLVLEGLAARVELLVAHVVDQPRHVRLEALGRLGGHLQR